jgi:hypothetical protein
MTRHVSWVALAVMISVATAHAEPDAWPRAAIDRPLTLDRGLLEANVTADAGRRRVLGLHLNDDALVLGVRWGTGERLELDAATAVTVVSPDTEWSGLIRAGAVWRLVRTDRLDLAPSARLDGCGACGFSIVSTASLGAPLRWRATPLVYLHAGRDLLPSTIRPYLALDLSLRAGAGAQVTRWLAIELDAELARVTVIGQLRDDRWLAHAPVLVSAIASVAPRIDVGVAVAVDRSLEPAAGWRALVTVAARSR